MKFYKLKFVVASSILSLLAYSESYSMFNRGAPQGRAIVSQDTRVLNEIKTDPKANNLNNLVTNYGANLQQGVKDDEAALRGIRAANNLTNLGGVANVNLQQTVKDQITAFGDIERAADLNTLGGVANVNLQQTVKDQIFGFKGILNPDDIPASLLQNHHSNANANDDVAIDGADFGKNLTGFIKMNIGDTVGKLDGLRANLATTTGNLANISGGTYNNIRDFNNFAIIMDSKAVNTRTLDGYYIPMLAALVAYLNVNNNKETVVIAKQVVTEMLAHL